MSPAKEFDTTTSCHERSLEEIWAFPYANPYDEVMRNGIYGRTPDDFAEMVEYETVRQDLLDYPVVSLQQIAETLGITDAELPPIEMAPAVSPGPRPSAHITRDDMFDVYEGIGFANYEGFVFNVELSVNWYRGGNYWTGAHADKAFEAFILRYRKFCGHRGIKPRYYAVFENSRRVGLHSHIHLCFPHAQKRALRDWMTNTLVMSDGRLIPKTDWKLRIRKDLNFVGQWKWFRYLMKGLDPALSRIERKICRPGVTLNKLVGVRQRNTGVVGIKRVRVSRSIIGEEERKKAGYELQRSMPYMSESERYGTLEYRRGKAERLAREILPLEII